MGVWIDGYGERKAREVREDTWGHLAPAKGRKYAGWILIAIGIYRDTIIVDNDFPGLENSPWQYDDFQDFVSKETFDFDPGIYKFEGWYKKFKNGNYRLSGKIKPRGISV